MRFSAPRDIVCSFVEPEILEMEFETTHFVPQFLAYTILHASDVAFIWIWANYFE